VTVARGTAFEGERLRDGVHCAADMAGLGAAMAEAGFGQDLIDKMTHKPWLSFLRQHLGDT